MTEELYISKRKGFVVNKYCGKNGVPMYQITHGTNFIQLTEEEVIELGDAFVKISRPQLIRIKDKKRSGRYFFCKGKLMFEEEPKI
jgi:hypothetical protein